MQIGLTPFRDERQVERLPGMLLLPFGRTTGDYAINRRRIEIHLPQSGGEGPKPAV
jgi:hypothetical protein